VGARYSRDQLFMFLRIVADSFGRRPRHKLLTGAALALGMGVATAALSVSLDVGDRLAKEFRSLGANLFSLRRKRIRCRSKSAAWTIVP